MLSSILENSCHEAVLESVGRATCNCSGQICACATAAVGSTHATRRSNLQPCVNLELMMPRLLQTDEGIEVNADLPGVPKEDIHVRSVHSICKLSAYLRCIASSRGHLNSTCCSAVGL
jgi:hypothetical protein